MPQDTPHDCLNVLEHQPLQYLNADEISVALLFVLAVQGAVKEVLIQIAVVGRTIQHFRAAVRTVDKPGENAASSCACHSMPLLADLLHLFKHIIVNNALMRVGEDRSFLNRCFPLLLVSDGVGEGLEIDHAARVFPPFENCHNGTAVPIIGIFRLLIWTFDSLQCLVGSWCQHLVRFQLVCDLLWTSALHTQGENVLHHIGGNWINLPAG